jgi:hypothetical protein
MSTGSDPIDDTSLLAPGANEKNSFVEIEDKKWTDEELMDDARPGRRSTAWKPDVVVEEDVVIEKEVSKGRFGKRFDKHFGKKKITVEWV